MAGEAMDLTRAQAQTRPSPAPSRSEPLLLTCEKLLDVLAAELGTFHDGMADAREHFLEPGADLTLTDLLCAPLDPLGRLIHLGLVGGAGRPAGESEGREEPGSDPHPAKSPCHDPPPSVCLAHNCILPPAWSRGAMRPHASHLGLPQPRSGKRTGMVIRART